MPMAAKVRLGNRLRVARAELRISQEELAAMVGVARQTISSIETGQYCPSALLAFMLSKRLGRPVETLFFVEGDEDEECSARRAPDRD